jgi:hypothetical protein
MPRIFYLLSVLVFGTYPSLNVQLNAKTPQPFLPKTGLVNIRDIQLKDTLDFNSKRYSLLPIPEMTEGSHAFGYEEPCCYYIKTVDENNMQYAMIKSSGNKTIQSFDISTRVQDFVKRIVDSGFCKAWHHCYGFSVQSYPRFIVLEMYYSGEKHRNTQTNEFIVFDAALKIICTGENVTTGYLLAKNNLLGSSDAFFVDDMTSSQLVSYRTETPSVIYKANENEVIFGDKEKNRFYTGVRYQDTLCVYSLSNKLHPIIKISGLDQSSILLFIHNGFMFIMHNGNVYYINIETQAGMGYKTTSKEFSIYPNKNGFYCDCYISTEETFRTGYVFIPI